MIWALAGHNQGLLPSTTLINHTLFHRGCKIYAYTWKTGNIFTCHTAITRTLLGEINFQRQHSMCLSTCFPVTPQSILRNAKHIVPTLNMVTTLVHAVCAGDTTARTAYPCPLWPWLQAVFAPFSVNDYQVSMPSNISQLFLQVQPKHKMHCVWTTHVKHYAFAFGSPHVMIKNIGPNYGTLWWWRQQ